MAHLRLPQYTLGRLQPQTDFQFETKPVGFSLQWFSQQELIILQAQLSQSGPDFQKRPPYDPDLSALAGDEKESISLPHPSFRM
jgi:hypothetical protein